MSHAKSGTALARGPNNPTLRRRQPYRSNGGTQVITLDRLTPVDLDLEEQARNVWAAVLEGCNVLRLFGRTRIYHKMARLIKSEGRYCPLVAIAELMVWLANRRISESRVRLLVVWLDSIVATIYCGNAHADLDALDLEEREAKELQIALRLRREIRVENGLSVSRDAYEAEALINQRWAAIAATRARELQRRARLLPVTRVATTRGEFA